MRWDSAERGRSLEAEPIGTKCIRPVRKQAADGQTKKSNRRCRKKWPHQSRKKSTRGKIAINAAWHFRCSTYCMRIFGFLSISTLLCSGAVAQDAAQVLAEINLARTQPQMYARIVAETARPGREGEKAIREAVRFLEKARPLPALSLSAGLSRA